MREEVTHTQGTVQHCYPPSGVNLCSMVGGQWELRQGTLELPTGVNLQLKTLKTKNIAKLTNTHTTTTKPPTHQRQHHHHRQLDILPLTPVADPPTQLLYSDLAAGHSSS